MYFENIHKNDITENTLIDTWLKQFHDVTLAEIEGDYERDKDGVLMIDETRRFYDEYAVTQEQHDEWDKQVRKELRKKLRMSKQVFDRGYVFVYLNIAPKVKK